MDSHTALAHSSRVERSIGIENGVGTITDLVLRHGSPACCSLLINMAIYISHRILLAAAAIIYVCCVVLVQMIMFMANFYIAWPLTLACHIFRTTTVTGIAAERIKEP